MEYVSKAHTAYHYHAEGKEELSTLTRAASKVKTLKNVATNKEVRWVEKTYCPNIYIKEPALNTAWG